MDMSTKGEIDFSFLASRQKKTCLKKLVTSSDYEVEDALDKGLITEEDLKEFRRIISSQHRTLDWKSIYGISETGTPSSQLQSFIEKGYMKNEGYTVVAFDMGTLLPNIVVQTTDADFNDIELYDFSGIGSELNKFFGKRYTTDAEYQNMLYTLYASNCPPLTAYLNRCLELSKGQKFIMTDLVGARRSYGKLSPIESITLPIIYNLNALVYIFSSEFKQQFRRGEKRFLGVSDYTLYYYIRNDKVNFVTNMKFELNGQTTHLKGRIIKSLGEKAFDLCR